MFLLTFLCKKANIQVILCLSRGFYKFDTNLCISESSCFQCRELKWANSHLLQTLTPILDSEKKSEF